MSCDSQMSQELSCAKDGNCMHSAFINDDIMENVHVILYFPGSAPGNEYEIHARDDMEFVGILARENLILLKVYGNVKCYCYVVDMFGGKAEALRHLTGATKLFMTKYKNRVEKEEKDMAKKEKKAKKQKAKKKSRGGVSSTPFQDASIKSEKETQQSAQVEKRNFSSNSECPPPSFSVSDTLKCKDESHDADENIIVKNEMVMFGRGPTQILKSEYDKIYSTEMRYTIALRTLLRATFPIDVLASHSLSGKPSPAFVGRKKETKPQLDPIKVKDIVDLVARKFDMKESVVRAAVTTALADAKKLGKKKYISEK